MQTREDFFFPIYSYVMLRKYQIKTYSALNLWCKNKQALDFLKVLCTANLIIAFPHLP